MVKFDQSKRKFLRTAVKTTAVLSVIAVSPFILSPLLVSKRKQTTGVEGVGVLYLDTNTNQIYKTKHTEYTGYTGRSDLDAPLCFAPWV